MSDKPEEHNDTTDGNISASKKGGKKGKAKGKGKESPATQSGEPKLSAEQQENLKKAMQLLSLQSQGCYILNTSIMHVCNHISQVLLKLKKMLRKSPINFGLLSQFLPLMKLSLLMNVFLRTYQLLKYAKNPTVCQMASNGILCSWTTL